MRYEMTDCEWMIIQPVLPDKPRGLPPVDDRRVLILGPYTTCYNRFNRWRKAGIWAIKWVCLVGKCSTVPG